MITLALPIPPSTNNLFATVGRKRVRTAEYRAWAAEAGLKANVQLAAHAGDLPMAGDISVTITIPANRRRDIDNYAKAVLDLMTFLDVWKDDRQVCRLSIEYGPVAVAIVTASTMQPDRIAA